ncbi:MAG: AraC family transcriptional regulator [Betaproteobacteria bacterium]|jgi:AraC-like DNA-binding protein|nr:AraC family transcriptional regulator [Betaproteobacteria bacterium]
MDALSEILKALRLNSGIFLEAEFTAPWCIDSAPGKDDVRHILPSAEHVTLYHLLTEGACSARIPGATGAVALEAGDLIMFPHGDGHRIGSDLQLAPVAAETLVMPSPEGGLVRIKHGGGGARTRFVCGYLACDSRLCKPLLDALPRMLKVPMGQGPASAWIIDTLRRGAAETHAPRAGADAVLAKLSELLFVEAMRYYLDSLPDNERGWFAGLRDPQVSRALALMHANPGRAWTVDDLGRESGLSRSSLAERFAALIGEPPMQYLTRWRLALAARALKETREPMLRIAEQVGYESEAAFNRAFKREFGMPPATWRRHSRDDGTGDT